VAGNTSSCLCGRHSLKAGGEYRQFLNNNFRRGTGAFSFPSIAAFLADTANSFSITLGNQNSSIAQGAFGFFLQDNYKLRPNLTLELGLRYDWNLTPEERYGRFIVFDPGTGSLRVLARMTTSTARTTRTSSRASVWHGIRSITARHRCEPPTRRLWTNR
jgi:outer membrane receptor protein involved in Fe transport